jgi:chorismate mutase
MEILLKKRPFIIGGPCSAETEEQMLLTATHLAATGKIDMLRVGIWKPRTKPGMFEGVGLTGLQWLEKVKRQTGLPVIVEVANTRHIEDCLNFKIDAFWIGARTTGNPFSVQEIAEAVRGVDIPVFIKNPMMADLELWCGAVERIAQVGIKHIGLIHRGFSSYGNSKYRNTPRWHLAIEMKERCPQLIMLNDPSHICGRRDNLFETAQSAIDLDFDGLMIESHIDPEAAWTDAKQQITPQQLKELIDKINWNNKPPTFQQYDKALEKLNHQITCLDDELLQMSGHRENLQKKWCTLRER